MSEDSEESSEGEAERLKIAAVTSAELHKAAHAATDSAQGRSARKR